MTTLKVLMLVDIQNDFFPGGPLGVPFAQDIIPIANTLMDTVDFHTIVATQDWHPKCHAGFASNDPSKRPLFSTIKLNGINQILWPDHCVWGTEGAKIHKDLIMDQVKAIFRKGMRPGIDSYSAFFENNKRTSTGVSGFIKTVCGNDIDLYIMGLATDYCIKYSVLDAIKLGFNTYLIKDGCRAVNMNPDDSDKAIEEMRNAGAIIMESSELL